MKRQPPVFIAIVALASSAAPVLASPILTINFQGTITDVGSSIAGAGVDVGDIVTGQFVYDLASPDTNLDPSYGLFAAESFTIAFDSGFSAEATGSHVNTQNDQQNGSATLPADGLTVVAFPVVGDSLNGRSVEAFQFGLRKENISGHLWFDDFLPDAADWAGITLADINAPDWRWMQFETQPGDPDIFSSQIRWTVDEFSVSAVPEPASFGLLCCVLGAMVLRKRRAERASRPRAPID